MEISCREREGETEEHGAEEGREWAKEQLCHQVIDLWTHNRWSRQSGCSLKSCQIIQDVIGAEEKLAQMLLTPHKSHLFLHLNLYNTVILIPE